MIFSAVDAVLLRSAPVTDPAAVVSIYTAGADARDRFSTSSYPDYVDLRDSGVLQSVAAFVMLVAAVATAIPVGRTVRVEPAAALRQE